MPASKRKRDIGRPVGTPASRPVDTPTDMRDQEPESDIDSSDVDVVDDRTSKRYAHYGSSSIKGLLKNAQAVRMQSKIDYKTQKDDSLVPGTQANTMLWNNRWEAFRTFILKVPADSPVTGEQIERCITSYARQIVGTRDGKPLTVRWASEAVQLIVNWARQNISGFSKLSTKEVNSMARTLKWMVSKKLLTKETCYEKNTAGFGTSAALVRRYLSSTVLNSSLGPQPSTRLLQVCGLVVLLVATAARTGDLTLSNGYNHMNEAWQYIKYSDVQILVAPVQQAGAAVDDYPMNAELTLRALKNKKDAQTKGNMSIRLSFDPSASTLYMNPIIWIILLGLKSGALGGRTYQDVIRAALARPNRQIVWAAGDRPLFHQFDTRCVPQYEKAATVNTTINSVNKFIRDCGVDLRVTPYAFRRGGLQDTLNLEGVPQSNERHAQQRAGHSHGAVRRGVTKLYTGDQRIDYLKLVDEQQGRLQDPFNRLTQAVDRLAVKTAPIPMNPMPAAAPPVVLPSAATLGSLHSAADQATVVTTAACFDDVEATPALPTDVERLVQESATREGHPEQDFIDYGYDDDENNDELWSTALEIADRCGPGAAAQPGGHDLIDDDDEFWSAAIEVAGDGGNGAAASASTSASTSAAAAARQGEPDLVDDDDNEMWSTAFGSLAEEPPQPMHGLVDNDDRGGFGSTVFGGGGLTEGDFQPMQDPVDGIGYKYASTASGVTAGGPFQSTHSLAEGDGNNRELGDPTAPTTQTSEFTMEEIGRQLLLAPPTDAGRSMIEQEIPAAGADETRLDELRVASAFVDTMVGLPDVAWALGSRTATTAGSVDPAKYAPCDGGIYRCLRCFRTYKYPSGHDKVCTATFAAELWETPTVDSAGVVTWTCKSCGRSLRSFSGVEDHQQSCKRAKVPKVPEVLLPVPPGYSQHGNGVDTILRCLRCRQVISHRGATKHTNHCQKNFNPTLWTIGGVQDNAPTWTCVSCNSQYNSFAGAKAHRCSAGSDSSAHGGVDEASEQGVYAASGQGVYAAGEQGVDGADKRRCPYCPRLYLRASKRMLEKHIRSGHPGRPVPADIDSHAKKPYKCPRGCTGRHERFTSEARLALHLREVHGEGCA